MSGDELIGNVTQVITDDLWLGADLQNIVAGPLDQRCFPAGRYGPKRVPCMACDQTELRRLNSKLSLDVGVSLTRRLMMLHAIRAKAPLEKIDNAAMFKLTSLNLKQIVREGKQPETCIAQLAERYRYFGGIVENFSVSSSLSASSILMPYVSASIFITAEPMSVNGT